MSGYEQSKTELGGKQNKTTPKREEVFNWTISNIHSELKTQKKAKEAKAIKGNLEYIDEGIIARILGTYLVDTEKLTKAELASYNFGYYTTSNALMTLLSMGIIPERLTKIINRKKITIREPLTTSRELNPNELMQEIGKRDSKDTKIDINTMSKEIQKNEYYLNGYTSGKTR